MPARRETSTTNITCPAIAAVMENMRAKPDTGVMSPNPTVVRVVKLKYKSAMERSILSAVGRGFERRRRAPECRSPGYA